MVTSQEPATMARLSKPTAAAELTQNDAMPLAEAVERWRRSLVAGNLSPRTISQ